MSFSSETIDKVMLDLETLGTSPGCVVLSIGACSFDHAGFRKTFHQTISIESSKAQGLVVDPRTEEWWQQQDRKVREAAFGGTEGLCEVLDSFHDWFRNLGAWGKITVWGNGADFDLPILAAAYKAANRPTPWAPYNGRCYRTLKNLLPHVKAPPFSGAKHCALDDAQHQANHAEILLRVL